MKYKYHNYSRSECTLVPAECNEAFHYLVTIKRNAIEFTYIEWLKDQLNSLKKSIKGADWSDNIAIELDSLNRLHLHTVVVSPKQLYYNKYRRKGWHIHFAPFLKSDIDIVYKYLNKSTNEYDGDKLQKEVASYIHHLSIQHIFNDK